ncbi:IIV6 [Acrasis kona]|uniref:IIV6 n=1 Tax=Acrasis kona TaxID=1008807 RepID=A0AAW2YIY9_9EUKA
MAALHYMLDYVLRTSPSDLLPEPACSEDIKTEGADYHGNAQRELDQPIKKHFKDYMQRSPEQFSSHLAETYMPIPTADPKQKIIDVQRERISSLERQLKNAKSENKDLNNIINQLKGALQGASSVHSSPIKKRPSLLVEDSLHHLKTRKRQARSPDLSDGDDTEVDMDYHDKESVKRRRTMKSKESSRDVGVHDEQSTSPTSHSTSNSSANSDNKFALPSDIHLDKKYFLKWNGQIYAVAKAFGDRNRLRKLVAKYETDSDKKASYLLDGEELRRLKSINPICHNTSYLGLYNLEFVRYFQDVTSRA